MRRITVEPEHATLCPRDKEWLEVIDRNGVPVDGSTLEHAAKVLIILWREHRQVLETLG